MSLWYRKYGKRTKYHKDRGDYSSLGICGRSIRNAAFTANEFEIVPLLLQGKVCKACVAKIGREALKP